MSDILSKKIDDLRESIDKRFSELLEGITVLKVTVENQGNFMDDIHKDVESSKDELHKLQLKNVALENDVKQNKRSLKETEGHCSRVERDFLEFKQNSLAVINRGKGIQWGLGVLLVILTAWKTWTELLK